MEAHLVLYQHRPAPEEDDSAQPPAFSCDGIDPEDPLNLLILLMEKETFPAAQDRV